MDSQERSIINLLKCLIHRREHPFSLQEKEKEMLDAIVYKEVEVRQPKSVKGVKALLCAIHTYKI